VLQAGAYFGFCGLERFGVFLLPLDGMLAHRMAGRSLRGTVRVKCAPSNPMYPGRPGLEPGLLDPETNAIKP